MLQAATHLQFELSLKAVFNVSMFTKSMLKPILHGGMGLMKGGITVGL